jgi:hypothetical protein
LILVDIDFNVLVDLLRGWSILTDEVS